MALSSSEMLRSNHATDTDGRIIVVGPNGAPIVASGSNAEGTPGSAPPSKALWIAGSDGVNLRAIATDANGIAKVDIAGSDVTLLVGRVVGGSGNAYGTPGTQPDTTARQIAASNSSRKRLTIRNVGSVTVYLGYDSSVTTSNGTPLYP